MQPEILPWQSKVQVPELQSTPQEQVVCKAAVGIPVRVFTLPLYSVIGQSALDSYQGSLLLSIIHLFPFSKSTIPTTRTISPALPRNQIFSESRPGFNCLVTFPLL